VVPFERDYEHFLRKDTLWQFRPYDYEDVNDHRFQNTKVLLKVLGDQLNELLKVFHDLTERTFFRVLEDGEIETMTEYGAHDVQLDGIGEIVGISRKQAACISSHLKNVDELLDTSDIPGTNDAINNFGTWVRRNGFSLYYPGRFNENAPYSVVEDVPYSDLVDFKIFLNNSNGTYHDLMRAVRQFWDTNAHPVRYEERFGNDARIILNTDLHQEEDGTYPNVRLYMLAPLVKAAGVELYRQATTTANEMRENAYAGGLVFDPVYETKLSYLLYPHEFNKPIAVKSRLENIFYRVLPELDKNRFYFNPMHYLSDDYYGYEIRLQMWDILDQDTLVFPTIRNGLIVTAIGKPQEPSQNVVQIPFKFVIIPNSIKDLHHDAFLNFDHLVSVYIPNSVHNVMDRAFKNCSSLISVTFDLSCNIWHVSENTFENCRSLETIILPESVRYIHDNAFSGCENLQEVIYGGTEEQWNRISISSGNEAISNATITFLGG
jgi:hypothetical protein